MDNSQAIKLTNQFRAVYWWLYRYVDGTWWAWDVDREHWDCHGSKIRMGRAFVALAQDMFPDDIKIQRQANLDYIQERLIKDLRFDFTRANLPADPRRSE